MVGLELATARESLGFSIDGYRATAVLQSPERANALSADLVAELSDALRQAEAAECRVFVIRSAARQFCAGFDLSDLERSTSAELSLRFLRLAGLFEQILQTPMLTIALIDGAAVGAGADLAAACDVRVATPQARLRFPGSAFGVVLGTARLAALVGASRALRLAGTGDQLDAPTALGWGLLDHLLATAEEAEVVLDELTAAAALRSPRTLGALRSATLGADPAGLADLARSLAGIDDLVGAIQQYRSATRKG